LKTFLPTTIYFVQKGKKRKQLKKWNYLLLWTNYAAPKKNFETRTNDIPESLQVSLNRFKTEAIHTNKNNKTRYISIHTIQTWM
jgi:hypothetical protein